MKFMNKIKMLAFLLATTQLFGCASDGSSNIGMGEIFTIGLLAAGAKAADGRSDKFADIITGTNNFSRQMDGFSQAANSATQTLDSVRELTNTDIEYINDRRYRVEIGNQDLLDLSNARGNQRGTNDRIYNDTENKNFLNLGANQTMNTTDSRYLRQYGSGAVSIGQARNGNTTSRKASYGGSSPQLYSWPSGTSGARAPAAYRPANGVCNNGSTYLNGMCYPR